MAGDKRLVGIAESGCGGSLQSSRNCVIYLELAMPQVFAWGIFYVSGLFLAACVSSFFCQQLMTRRICVRAGYFAV